MKRTVSILLGLLWIGMVLEAAPAAPGKRQYRQPDGTVFSASLHGDEWFSWMEDREGNVILYNRQKKRYEYAKIREGAEGPELVPSGNAVGQIKSSAAGKAGKIDKAVLKKIWDRKRSRAARVMHRD